MATSEKSEKKIASVDFTIIIIIVLIVMGVFMGFKFNRLNKSNEELSKRERQRIEENAVLKASKDSLLREIQVKDERLKILQADVKEANKNTISSERVLRAYKERYAYLRDSVHLDTNNCPVLLLECERLNERHEGYELVLLANVKSYKIYTDTLEAKVLGLETINKLWEQTSKNKDEELAISRRKIKRRGIVNWGLAGLATGMTIVLIAK